MLAKYTVYRYANNIYRYANNICRYASNVYCISIFQQHILYIDMQNILYIDMVATNTVYRYASNIYCASMYIIDSVLTLPLSSTKCYLTKLFVPVFPILLHSCV